MTEPARINGQRHHAIGFWVAGAALLCIMAFSAVPTPLYVLYQRRDHFSTIVVTVVYAAYAVGVVVSLFLAGHLSDRWGRRRMLLIALLLDVGAAGIFLDPPGLVGLLVARVLCGVVVGLTTATATAYLAELHVRARPDTGTRRAELLATAANLGGIGFGPLVAGVLAQYAPAPLLLPYLVFAIALLVLAGIVALAPETVPRQARGTDRWRPQRVAVPEHARPAFFAATGAGLAAFAVFGVFTSLVPSFLAAGLHQTSHALAGAVVFAAFAAGAGAQLAVGGLASAPVLRRGLPVLIGGLALLAGGMWLASLAVFVLGGLTVGAGAGLVFRGALVVSARSAPPQVRAEVLAGFFLGAYVGLSLPVVGLGVATRYAPARDVMPVFALLVAAAVAGAVRALLRGPARTIG